MRAAEKTSLERVIDICMQSLNVPRVLPDDDLFEAGCDSVKAVIIALEVEKACLISVPAEMLFDRSTPRAIADWIEEERSLTEWVHTHDASAAD